MIQKLMSNVFPKSCRWAALAVLTAVFLAGTAVNGFAAEAESENTPVDLKEPVSMNITAGPVSMLDDLANANVVLDIYRVATASAEEGATIYTLEVTNDFSSLSIGTDMTNESWTELARAAAAVVRDASAPITPVEEGAQTGTQLPMSDPGLYLVIARGEGIADYWGQVDGNVVTRAESDLYNYYFGPELIALPGRYSDILDDGSPNLYMADNNMANLIDWKYNVSASLKPTREERTGALNIVKTLLVYENSAPATFVFDVEAVLDGVSVYSDVITMTFDSAGDMTSTIYLPVGAVVTVTEVYTGANYELVSDATQTATITLGGTASVAFTNTYDNTTYGGGSIVNSFTYSETNEQNWMWTQTFDR